ncbi:carbohydrate kinase [Mucilaginibacter sp. SMC90]|uniref:carbohydrate kinase family protein n=1 Tax=Mucilaginibacter sp. SMC90 TaxID=2929803 RepID=UPI001FB37BB6|nr:carbohydrate kinase [Mucilaginibacter sp. SMC90]UOE46833.1 carbohydrate kinase [Mucilaginibacter sp. SMC90]
MNEVKNNHQAICYGEILWDVLPDGPQPGGAPLNVAYHLNKLGVNTGIISKVGEDISGYQLVRLIEKWGIGKSLLQHDDEYDTSEVRVVLNEQNDASYEILYPVAWDFINKNDKTADEVKAASFLVYGSLSSRNQTSRDTLSDLLENEVTKVLDINMREPYVKKDILKELLHKADVAKFNLSELKRCNALFGSHFTLEQDQVNFLQETFSIPEIVVTKGEAGASYYSRSGYYHAACPKVKVADTIGSGDAFLAAFIAGLHNHYTPQEVISNAAAMGAFVASKKGGCPEYQIPDFLKFKSQ